MTTFYAKPTQAQSTRNCLDPWFFAMLNSRRELMPCCWHPPIGKLEIGASLSDLLNGPAIREIREQLLTGQLNQYCRACPARPLATTAELRNHLTAELTKEQAVSSPNEGAAL